MLSAIQTRQHSLASIALVPSVELTDGEKATRAITCSHRLALSYRENDTRYWLARMRVELIHPENGPKSLYTGHCELIGEFELHPDVAEADRLKFASMNAGAILYGAIREWFAILTARSIHGLAEIPTLDARVFLPATPQPPKQDKTAKTLEKQAEAKNEN